MPVHLATLRDIGDADVTGWTGTEDIDYSAARRQYPSDHLEKRAFASAIRSNDCHALPGMQVKGNFMQRWTPVIPEIEFLDI
jgi:hypothetical protein